MVKIPAVPLKMNSVDPKDRSLLKVLKIIKDRDLSKCVKFIYYPGLANVEKNLSIRKYTNRPWRFIKDVNESLNKIMENHSKRTKIHQMAVQILEMFSNQMDIVMDSWGYCCGRDYMIRHRDVSCNGSNKCLVEINMKYYRYEEWTYCNTCFTKIAGETVKVNDDLIIPKLDFAEFYLEPPHPEKFVHCHYCKRKFHEVCVLYIRLCNQPFYCSQCRGELNIKTYPLRAEKLPSTECDRHITEFLTSNGVNTKLLTIRLLSAMERKVDVLRRLQEFRPGATEYAYRNETLFTFFDSGESTDVCFFAVFFQLYGNECSESNRNSAYISYIDSVNLFSWPNRTLVYRLILLGLFDFLKLKGCSKIFLWSCPPRQNQDYIFHVKPTTMKMPTKSRLSKWYLDLLEMGVALNVICSYKGINDHAVAEKWQSFSDVPYLEGDLWITRMEEIEGDVTKERNKLLRDINSLTKKMRTTNGRKKHDIMNRLATKKQEVRSNMSADLWRKMQIQMTISSNEYFVIQLTNQPKSLDISSLPTIDRIWMNNRHLLVDYFWDNMLEFKDERCAKFSTYSMLMRLFMDCNICVKCNQVSDEGINGLALCRNCYMNETFRFSLQYPSVENMVNWNPVIKLTRCDKTRDTSESLNSKQNERTSDLDSASSMSSEPSDLFNMKGSPDSGFNKMSPEHPEMEFMSSYNTRTVEARRIMRMRDLAKAPERVADDDLEEIQSLLAVGRFVETQEPMETDYVSSLFTPSHNNAIDVPNKPQAESRILKSLRLRQTSSNGSVVVPRHVPD